MSDPWPFPPIDHDPISRTTALMIVDMQYFDTDRRYGVGPTMRERAPQLADHYYGRVESVVIPNVKRLLEAFRSVGLRVIHVVLGAELEDLGDMPPRLRERSRRRQAAVGRPTFYARTSFECRILPDLEPAKGELVVNKTTLGAFNSTTLEVTLRNMGIERVVIAGVVTTACVETTARDAADRGLAVTVVEDGCAAWDLESQVSSLRAIRRHFGRVATTDELLAEIAAVPA